MVPRFLHLYYTSGDTTFLHFQPMHPWSFLPTGSIPRLPLFIQFHLIWVHYKFVCQLSQPTFLSVLYLNSARHNVVIKLCWALKIFNFFCLRWFSKLRYSFVAIELLAFFKNKNFLFIDQENSWYLGLKMYVLFT